MVHMEKPAARYFFNVSETVGTGELIFFLFVFCFLPLTAMKNQKNIFNHSR